MYEIWLGLNIVWEIALQWRLPLLIGLLAWATLVGLAWGRGARWRASWPPAAGLGALSAIVAFFAVPGLSKSSLAEMGYWVDWANLTGIALGVGAVALAYAWPALALRAGPISAPKT